MTSGTKTLYSGGHTVSFRSWNGANGKYDALGRPKWNSYTMTGYRRQYHDTTLAPYTVDPTVGVLTLLDTNAQLNLLNGISEAIRGHGFNAGVFLATGNQTLDLASATLGRTYRSMRALKRGRIGEALRELGKSGKAAPRTRGGELSLKDFSSAWLELQYGWLPLLSDVHEAGLAWNQANADLTSNWESSTQTSRSKETVDAVHNSLSGSSTKSEFRHLKVLRARYSSTSHSALTLGLTDPASVIWELTPWSFVADWFIPIGSYLEALNNAPLWDSASFLTTDVRKATRSRASYQIHVLEWSGGVPKRTVRSQATAQEQRISMTRSTAAPGPVPTPSFKGFEKAMSWTHCENAMALIHQLF